MNVLPPKLEISTSWAHSLSTSVVLKILTPQHYLVPKSNFLQSGCPFSTKFNKNNCKKWERTGK